MALGMPGRPPALVPLPSASLRDEFPRPVRPPQEQAAPPACHFGTSRPTASGRGRKGPAAAFAFLVSA